jgi:hypothetical protein
MILVNAFFNIDIFYVQIRAYTIPNLSNYPEKESD